MVYSAPTANAGFNWGKVWNEVVDVLEDSGKETIKSSKQTKSAISREITLDGTYYNGKADKAYNKCDEIVSVNYFTLTEPAVVDIHTVVYADDNASAFSFRLFDEDDNQIGDKLHVCGGETKDDTVVLPAGRYKISVMYFCITKTGYGEYKFKVNQTPVSVTAGQDLARPEKAHQIYFGTNTVNYLKNLSKSKDEHQYYSFDLQQASDVRIYNVNLGGEGSLGISILDEDERVIDKYYLNNGVIDKTISLPQGKYFLRVERSYSAGVVYQLRISG